MKNQRNEERQFDLQTYEDIIKIQHFNTPPKFFEKEEFFNLIKRLPENEQIFVCFNSEANQKFNEIKYAFVSNQSHFYFSDNEIQEVLGLKNSEIGLIKKKKFYSEEKNTKKNSFENKFEIKTTKNEKCLLIDFENENEKLSEDSLIIARNNYPNEDLQCLKLIKTKNLEVFDLNDL